MNIRDLHYFVAVAKHQHFGKAAEECCVSQPTLSMQLKKLEGFLGVILFERDKKHVKITTIGQRILEHAQQILQTSSDIRTIARLYQDPFQGEFTIGAFPTLAPFIFPKIIPQLLNTYPNLQLLLTEEKTEVLINQLKQGDIDMALLALPVENEFFNMSPLFTENFLFAVHSSHRLANKKFVTLEDVKHETYLLLEDGHCLSGQALEACQWAGAQKFHHFRATSIETLRQMVATNLGVTFVPEIASHVQNNAIKYLPIQGALKPTREIGLFWRKSTPFKECFTEISEHIKKLPR